MIMDGGMCAQVCMYEYLWICIHLGRSTYKYLCMFVHIYVCMYIRVYIHVGRTYKYCMHVCMYVCKYVLYVCACVYQSDLVIIFIFAVEFVTFRHNGRTDELLLLLSDGVPRPV